MNKLIIVEGPQGAGKTTLTNALREVMTGTNLIRMSGVADKTISGKEKSKRVHLAQLNAILETADCSINYILDRSFLTELVYGKMGLKIYNADDLIPEFEEIMKKIVEVYDVKLIVLEPNEETLKERLNRDKGEYEKFSVESSMKQAKALNEILKITESFWEKTEVFRFDESYSIEQMLAYITK